LERAGLGDAVVSHDQKSRAVKAALADAGGAAPMLAPGLQAWLAGADQLAPSQEVQEAQAAQMAQLGEHMTRVLQGGSPAGTATGDGMDPRYRDSWIARQRRLAAEDAERFGKKRA